MATGTRFGFETGWFAFFLGAGAATAGRAAAAAAAAATGIATEPVPVGSNISTGWEAAAIVEAADEIGIGGSLLGVAALPDFAAGLAAGAGVAVAGWAEAGCCGWAAVCFLLLWRRERLEEEGAVAGGVAMRSIMDWAMLCMAWAACAATIV
jgi:hypothetical protein